MRRFAFIIQFGMVAVPTLFAALMVILQPRWLVGLEQRYFDLLVDVTQRSAAPSTVTVVEIDEESLRRVGRWPWPRAVVGQLVESAFQAQASVVAVDLLFSEPDGQDEKLAAALRRGRAVVGVYFGFGGRRASCTSGSRPLAAAPRKHALFRASSELCGIEAIAGAAQAGFLNAASDADGTLRRLPMLIEFEGKAHPSLALAAAIGAGASHELRFGEFGRPELEVGGRHVPLDPRGCLLLRPPHALARVRAADLLEGKARPADLEGRAVVIGGTAVGLQDRVVTAGRTSVPGVHVQAAALDQLLRGDFVSRPSWGILLESLVVLGVGGLAAFGAGRLGFRLAALGAGVAVVVLGGVSGAAALSGVLLSPLMAQLTVVAVTLMAAPRGAGEARRQAAELRAFMVTALESLAALREGRNAPAPSRIQRYMALLCAACAEQPRLKGSLDAEAIELMVELSPIRDLGKAGVPDKVLNKAGALSPDELELLKRHVQMGLDILDRARERSGLRDERLFRIARDLVYSHHERWDGSGYPRKLKGEEIPVAGRILAVADVYEALVAEGPHKPGIPHAQAAAMIVAGRGTLFDPEVVDAFVATERAWEALGAIE